MADESKFALVTADFMFGARIASAFKGKGWDSALVGSVEEARNAAINRAPDLLIVELGANGWERVEGIRRFKADAETQEIPILAFGSHKSRSLLEGARQAGADLVASNGALVARFDLLIERIQERRVENRILLEESEETG